MAMMSWPCGKCGGQVFRDHTCQEDTCLQCGKVWYTAPIVKVSEETPDDGTYIHAEHCGNDYGTGRLIWGHLVEKTEV